MSLDDEWAYLDNIAECSGCDPNFDMEIKEFIDEYYWGRFSNFTLNGRTQKRLMSIKCLPEAVVDSVKGRYLSEVVPELLDKCSFSVFGAKQAFDHQFISLMLNRVLDWAAENRFKPEHEIRCNYGLTMALSSLMESDRITKEHLEKIFTFMHQYKGDAFIYDKMPWLRKYCLEHSVIEREMAEFIIAELSASNYLHSRDTLATLSFISNKEVSVTSEGVYKSIIKKMVNSVIEDVNDSDDKKGRQFFVTPDQDDQPLHLSIHHGKNGLISNLFFSALIPYQDECFPMYFNLAMTATSQSALTWLEDILEQQNERLIVDAGIRTLVGPQALSAYWNARLSAWGTQAGDAEQAKHVWVQLLHLAARISPAIQSLEHTDSSKWLPCLLSRHQQAPINDDEMMIIKSFNPQAYMALSAQRLDEKTNRLLTQQSTSVCPPPIGRRL